MTTLSNSSTFAIADTLLENVTADVLVLPIAGPGEGKGRLVHPTLGTLDYQFAPDEWTGFRTDIFVKPVWSAVQTLGSQALTLWEGKVRDRVVQERWTDELVITTDELDLLMSFAATPPDPTLGEPDGFIRWYPSYISDLGFYVAQLEVACGGAGDDIDIEGVIDDNAWVRGPMLISMRIAGRIS